MSSLDLSTIKKWVIPEGEVQSVTINGVVVWKKPSDTPVTQANHIKGTASAEFTAKLGDVTLTFPAGNFDVEYTGAQLTDLSSVFRGKAGLTSITSFGVDISKVEKITNFIYGCKNVVSVDFTGCDFSGVSGAGNAFCSQSFPNDSWTTIKGGLSGLHDCSQLSFKYLNVLTHDSIVGVINSLGQSKWSPAFILNDTQKAALSATEKAVLINKGWTLA